MNVYIPIEVKARELEGRSLLAFEAASRGHTVIIGGKEDTLGLARSGLVAPGIIYDKSLAKGQIDYLRDIKGHGHIVTCQDEEHGLLDATYEKFARTRFSSETLEISDAVYCWGDHDALSLKSVFPNHASKFVNTGSPRADLWRNDFDFLFADKKVERPYILIVSNFGYIFNNMRFWDILNIQRQFLNVDNFDFRDFFNDIGYQATLVGEFLVMIRQLAKKFPSIDFIVRPHPVEDKKGWDIFLNGSPDNLKIKKEGGITKWIRNSKGIIHNGCTSALEATVSGRPVFTYRPKPSEFERYLPNQFGLESSSADELANQLSKVFQGDESISSSDLQFALISERFSNLNGAYAFEKIVDHWETLAPITSQAIFPNAFSKVEWVSKQLYRATRNVISKKRNTTKKSPKFPFLQIEEMLDLKDRYSRKFERFKNVVVKRFGERSYLLSKQSK